MPESRAQRLDLTFQLAYPGLARAVLVPLVFVSPGTAGVPVVGLILIPRPLILLLLLFFRGRIIVIVPVGRLDRLAISLVDRLLEQSSRRYGSRSLTQGRTAHLIDAIADVGWLLVGPWPWTSDQLSQFSQRYHHSPHDPHPLLHIVHRPHPVLNLFRQMLINFQIIVLNKTSKCQLLDCSAAVIGGVIVSGRGRS